MSLKVIDLYGTYEVKKSVKTIQSLNKNKETTYEPKY